MKLLILLSLFIHSLPLEPDIIWCERFLIPKYKISTLKKNIYGLIEDTGSINIINIFDFSNKCVKYITLISKKRIISNGKKYIIYIKKAKFDNLKTKSLILINYEIIPLKLFTKKIPFNKKKLKNLIINFLISNKKLLASFLFIKNKAVLQKKKINHIILTQLNSLNLQNISFDTFNLVGIDKNGTSLLTNLATIPVLKTYQLEEYVKIYLKYNIETKNTQIIITKDVSFLE